MTVSSWLYKEQLLWEGARRHEVCVENVRAALSSDSIPGILQRVE